MLSCLSCCKSNKYSDPDEQSPLLVSKIDSCGNPYTQEYDEESCDLRGVGLAHDAAWEPIHGFNMCCRPTPFVVWRFLLFGGMLGLTIYSYLDFTHGPKKFWWTKLTNWGLLLETTYFFFAMVSTYQAGKMPMGEMARLQHLTEPALGGSLPDSERKTMANRTPWFVSVAMCLQAIMLPISLLIVILYWALVFDGTLYTLSALTHGLNFAVMLLDLWASRQPLRIVQGMWPVIFGFIYILFTYVYYKAGGTYEDGISPYIYKALNWETHPMFCLGLGAGIVFGAIPVIFMLCWGAKIAGCALGARLRRLFPVLVCHGGP